MSYLIFTPFLLLCTVLGCKLEDKNKPETTQQTQNRIKRTQEVKGVKTDERIPDLVRLDNCEVVEANLKQVDLRDDFEKGYALFKQDAYCYNFNRQGDIGMQYYFGNSDGYLPSKRAESDSLIRLNLNVRIAEQKISVTDAIFKQVLDRTLQDIQKTAVADTAYDLSFALLYGVQYRRLTNKRRDFPQLIALHQYLINPKIKIEFIGDLLLFEISQIPEAHFQRYFNQQDFSGVAIPSKH